MHQHEINVNIEYKKTLYKENIFLNTLYSNNPFKAIKKKEEKSIVYSGKDGGRSEAVTHHAELSQSFKPIWLKKSSILLYINCCHSWLYSTEYKKNNNKHAAWSKSSYPVKCSKNCLRFFCMLRKWTSTGKS